MCPVTLWRISQHPPVTSMLGLSSIYITRSLVAVEPRRPPMTDVGTETALRLDQRKHFRKSKHLLRWEVKWCNQTSFTCVDLHLLVSRLINVLSVTDFDRKGIISGVRVQAGLYLDMLDADRSPNAVSVHAGISQVDFEVDCPPPAPPGHLLITMVKEAVFCTKNEFRKMKKSRISHWSESDENAKWLRDCLWLCQACKRGFTCWPM